jgi:predicted ATP-dependent protease
MADQSQPERLPADEVGMPSFHADPDAEASVFDLPSHERAREALDFALKIDRPGYNLFVVGGDRSGRMSATQDFLREYVRGEAPSDWVYLNNFTHPHRPRPYRLPAGQGRKFRDAMEALVPRLREAIAELMQSEAFQDRLKQQTDSLQAGIRERLGELNKKAEAEGLTLVQGEQGGFGFMPLAAKDDPQAAEKLSEEERKRLAEAADSLSDELAQINRWRTERQSQMMGWYKQFERDSADRATAALFDDLMDQFGKVPGLSRWLIAMHQDVLDNLDAFKPEQKPANPIMARPQREPPERRYAVNLLVDNTDRDRPPVILESNPTYTNLFGRIEYRQQQGGLDTDFTLIRGGAVHKANGGVLILRAEALARDGLAWLALKAALRDGEIAIEEHYRMGAVPIANAPRPKPIPLKLKVVIVGSPNWYYTFFSVDPDFPSYFKLKADIDPDMEVTTPTLARYAGLVNRLAEEREHLPLDRAALARLLGEAARWARRRDRLSAQYELFQDLIGEAAVIARDGRRDSIDEPAVESALAARRRRNARYEERLRRSITDAQVMIDVSGEKAGQINGLTVRDMGDHAFGMPVRITARASIGRGGVTNIEREVAMGGPIQQKGALVIQGFLAGRFARRIPPAFTCSITFEQSYGGVEGDSASMAELLAVLSDVAGVPLRQDLAITGSVNQHGQSQVVGGVTEKVEGFFYTCQAAGPLTGNQGVALPRANAVDLVLDDVVSRAVEEGQFHIHVYDDVESALTLFTGWPAGTPDDGGHYPADTVMARVAAELRRFDEAIGHRDVD